MLRISPLMPGVYIVCRENTDLAALIGPILLSLVNSTDVKNTDILKIRNLLRFYVLTTVLTEIYPKNAKRFIQIAGHKTFNTIHNVLTTVCLLREIFY